MKSEISQRIRDQWSELTKSDRLVASRLQAEYPIAGLKTLAELAERAGVSAPSVIRCIRKLGFDSYPEFQRALHDEVQARFDDRGQDDGAYEAELPLYGEFELAYTKSLRETIRLVQQSDVDKLAALLARSRSSVLCLGGRISQSLAMIFQAQLLRLRRNVELVSSNPVERAERLMDIGKNDIVVVFDYGPYDPQTGSFGRLASQNKATVVCFTDEERSPAAKYAQFVISADIQTVGAINSLSAAICSLELVLSEVRDKIGTRATSRQESIANVPGVGAQIDNWAAS